MPTTTAAYRKKKQAKWRRLKAAQLARDPEGYRAKRRAYYQANKERICERQRRYHHEVAKVREWRQWAGEVRA